MPLQEKKKALLSNCRFLSDRVTQHFFFQSKRPRGACSRQFHLKLFLLLFHFICDFNFFSYPIQNSFRSNFIFAQRRVLSVQQLPTKAHTNASIDPICFIFQYFLQLYSSHMRRFFCFFASFFFPPVRLKTAAASSFSSFFRHSFTSSFRISFFFSVSFFYRVSCFGCCRGDKLAVCPNQANAWTNERMVERSVGLRPTVVCGGLISLSGHSGLSGLMLGLQLDIQSK